MTLPGGAAAKLGHRYENWWTLSELVRMLRGDTDSLRIEKPGLDGVEFVVKVGGQQEYHQAKRSHPSGKWSMAMLASAGVLASIGKYLIGHQSRFVFVSSSDARELADLCEGAVDAESFEEFEVQFLGAKRRANGHERVLKAWQCDGRAAWNALRRIDVHTISERQLEDKVRLGLSVLFLGEVDHLHARLAAVVDNAVHGTIERGQLLGRLEDAGFLLRKVSSPHAARHAVVGATDRYLHGVRRSLIQRSLIPRDKTDEIVERVTGEQPGDCALVGLAGTGKTGCVIEVIEKLVANGHRVLALRLDRHMSATSTTDLGRRLELEESPALVLSAASKPDEARPVLIIDQLDAVSAMSGRSSEAFDVVEQLLMEAKASSIGTVVVCRAFDWHNDPRLRSLIREDNAEVVLGGITSDDVRSVLTKGGYNASAFSARQLELLHLPQNLSMFLDANFTSSIPFSSEGHLLGRYWEEKKRLIEDRAEGAVDRWTDVIATMCNAMSATQKLSVRREGLDQFSHRYVEQFVSENVLVADGDSYAFGHERFFDYCFARLFVNREESLAAMLKSSEQHLFRRAQVRQVLAYLREANFERYISELHSVVFESGIRPHIKDLVFAWLARVDDPRDEEWGIWSDYVEPYLSTLEEGRECSDKQIVRSWERVFYAKSWFKKFDDCGVIGGWLRGGPGYLEVAMEYLCAQQNYWPDQVAKHLAPFANEEGDWPHRLRAVILRAGGCASRDHFDLFLRLLENGTLDVEIGGEELKRVYSRLGQRRLDWIPEALAQQIRRLCVLARTPPESFQIVQPFDVLSGVAIGAVQDAAKKDPASFVSHVLPAVLELADATSIKGQSPPFRDTTWRYLMHGSSSGADACLHTLASALGKLANDGKDVRGWIEMLSGKATYVANHLLLALYRGAGSRYAEEAVLAFCNNPWRFRCGYSDSSFWCATETLRSVLPHCSRANLAALESVMLAYVHPYERTKDGLGRRGWGSFNLLTAIPEERRSEKARRRYQELRRKFDRPAAGPRGVVGGFVMSPIPSDSAAKLDDKEWLHAIAAYASDRSIARVAEDGTLRGGASELAAVFGDVVRDEPERFANLCLLLPAGTNAVYFSALLRALGRTNVEDVIKVAVCQKVFESVRVECGGDIADLLAKANLRLPDQALDMLVFLAVEGGDLAEEERWKDGTVSGEPYFGGDIDTNGINTIRGRATLAIGELIRKDGGYIAHFESTLGKLLREGSVSVASCVAYALRCVAGHNPKLGIDLFLSIDFSEERLLGAHHVYRFIQENLCHGVDELRGLLVRMLRSQYPDVARAGAQLGSMAALLREDARYLAEEARRGGRYQRLGCADVAAANLGDAECRDWCERTLSTYFGDDDREVRAVAASCFRSIPEDALAACEDLMTVFCDSPAFEEGAFFLLNALRDARTPLPGVTLHACERHLGRTDGHGMDAIVVGELVFRLYQQHPNDEWTKGCLGLIDRLCLEAPVETGQRFEDLER